MKKQLKIYDAKEILIKGIKGDIGLQGPAGPKGEDVSMIGPQGLEGPQGIPGIDGLPGKPGRDSFVPGPQGNQGEIGPIGPQGIQGTPGKDGSIITSVEIKEKLTTLKGNDRIDITSIRNSEPLVAAASKIAKIDFDDQRWHGGGADRLTKLKDVLITTPLDTQVLKYDSTTGKWKNAAGSTATGNVVGPASSTDSDIAVFDGTTGKLLKDGGHKLSEYLTGVTADSPLSGAGTSASHLTVDLSSRQPLNTNLTSIGGLANASGALVNNGAGTFSYTAMPSVGTWGALNYPTWVSGTPFVKMTAAGTFALDTNTYGTFTLPTLTSGSVLFSNGSTIAQDNANLFWDNTNKRLGIGVNSPGQTVDILGSFNARFNASNTTVIFGIGTDGSFIAGDTGIFRFGDRYNQMSNVWGSPIVFTAYNGVNFNSGNYAGTTYIQGGAISLTETLAINSNQNAGQILTIGTAPGGGTSSIGMGYHNAIQISIIDDNNYSASLDFSTHPPGGGGGAQVSRFRIMDNGNIGINNSSPNANAILDVTSTTKAFMPPRMTTTQKAAIASPTAGMMVFDSTLGKLSVYGNGGTWETVTSL